MISLHDTFKNSLKSVSNTVEWLKLWGTVPVFSWIRAASLYEAGKYQEAANHYKFGLSTNSSHPASLAARLDLAFCLTKCKEFDEAEKVLKTSRTLYPYSKEVVIRLIKLLRFTGRPLEAAWSARTALRHLKADAEVIGYFLISALEQSDKPFLVREALGYSLRFEEVVKNPILEVARAKSHMMQGYFGKAKNSINSVCRIKNPPVEGLLVAAELSIEMCDKQIAKAYLTRALHLYPDFPRVQGMLAELYLQTAGCNKEETAQNITYAKNLAESACKSSKWLAAREVAILASVYGALGDKESAGLIAEKAWNTGKAQFFSSGFGRPVGGSVVEDVTDGEELRARGMTVSIDGLRVKEYIGSGVLM